MSRGALLSIKDAAARPQEPHPAAVTGMVAYLLKKNNLAIIAVASFKKGVIFVGYRCKNVSKMIYYLFTLPMCQNHKLRASIVTTHTTHAARSLEGGLCRLSVRHGRT